MLQVILLRLDSNDYPHRTWVGKQYSKAKLIQDLEIVQKLSKLEVLEGEERSQETYAAWKKLKREIEEAKPMTLAEATKDWPDDLAKILRKGLAKGINK